MKRRRSNEIIKPKLLITRFEDLSNELIYEILDYCSIYEIFANLNLRFLSLFTNSSLSWKINLPLTSKIVFQHRCKYIINPNIQRIISLNVINYFFNFFSIDFFTSLQSLSCHSIQSDNLLHLLSQLNSLPRFSSLTIHSADYFQDENSIYLSIFRLSKLKYCKLTFPRGGERAPLPITTKKCQTLERLIINGQCRLDQLISILSYTPALRYLSCQHLHGSGCPEIEVPLSLTSICFSLYHVSFDELKLFLSKVSFRLKKLSIRKCNDDNYFHAEQWEQLILDYMPCLCIFDFQYSVLIQNEDSHRTLIDRFSTHFWIERKWFFDYEYYQTENLSHMKFFSIVPYRYHHFVLSEQINDDVPKSYRNNHINLARHLTMEGHLKTDQYSIQFPRVTKLTLKENNIQDFHDINSIVPLTQIIDLDIKDEQFSMNQLIELLHLSPNVQSLTLSNLLPLQTKIPRFLSIVKVIIDDECKLEHVKFLIHLFPHLQSLEIGIDEDDLENIVRFLLSKPTINSLFSLFLLNMSYKSIEKVQRLINDEKLLDDYTFERVHGGFYLWW